MSGACGLELGVAVEHGDHAAERAPVATADGRLMDTLTGTSTATPQTLGGHERCYGAERAGRDRDDGAAGGASVPEHEHSLGRVDDDIGRARIISMIAYHAAQASARVVSLLSGPVASGGAALEFDFRSA